MIKVMRYIGNSARDAIVASVMVGFFSAVYADPQIEAVSSSIQGGVDVVRIDFSEPLKAVPDGVAVQSPARIALDFPGVRNGMGHTNVGINQGNVKGVNVVQANDRTRVVLNLKRATPYKSVIDGNSLLVSLAPASEAASSEKGGSTVFSESRNTSVAPLKNIDFRRGVENAGRVVIDLDSNQVGVDIRQQGDKLVVEFLKTSLPEGLRRKLDVSDFGTPVQMISAVQSGDRVRMTIEPKGQWEHSAYQSDNQLVVEIRQQKTDDGKLAQGGGYRGEKLSLNFQNIEVRSLLQVIADFTNFNVVTSDSVTGNVTLRLKDVPWDQALDIILQAKGLGMKKNGNVLQIAPKDELAAKEKAELEAQAAIQDLEPLRTQSFQLNYAKAADIAEQLTRSSGTQGGNTSRILSNRGSVIAEPRTNQIFVSDIPSRLAQVQEMIAKLDVAVRQVLIEARIVEASDSFGRSLGVKLGGSDLRGVRGGDPGYRVRGSNRVALGGSYNAVSATTGEGESSMLNTSTTQFLNLPASAVDGSAPATFALSLFSAAANRFLNLELSAMEADGQGKVVSSPRVVTANQVKAIIEQGTEFAYQESAQNGATSVQFKKAVLSLEVTPQITPEGSIILDLAVNKDSPGTVVAGAMSIDTKRVKTQVLVENGGTVVIGGIFELTEKDSVAKVPLLGDIPVVGNLFKNRTRSSRKEEILVFITPKIISDQTALR
ncbi:secretin [Ottowia sp. oral taxon 894]|uniref:type IV pilus secretin PilQ n=1 Tax=Ottowia sp. oral taxon 894 TaxID=1658672 RepID=UPI00068138FE|nr:type IV pilus secretin PilQ [Ottowia sp. oral taxon 894]AKU66751.1 secretin [Ottowia sp. oral taxon 894]